MTHNREQILADLEAIIKEEKLSDAQIGRIISCSASTVSRMRRGKYTGDVDRHLALIAAWLDDRHAAGDVQDDAYVPTSIGEHIRTVCAMAVHTVSMGIVQTPTGVGKTMALQSFARDKTPNQCVYMYAGEAMRGKRDVLTGIARELGLHPKGTVPELYQRIHSRIAGFNANNKGVRFLLIVDEATTLLPSSLNMLRNLHDSPACRAAVVIADTTRRMEHFLYGGAKQIAGGNEQLRSRAKAQYILRDVTAISNKDIDAVCDATVKALGFGKSKLTPLARKLLRALARTDGALRNVVSRLKTCHFYADQLGLKATFSYAELDFVCQLAGLESEGCYQTDPFRQSSETQPMRKTG